MNQSDDGGRGVSSVPSLALLFAYTLPVKRCSAHTKVPLMCTVSKSHKHLQNKYRGKSPGFLLSFQTHICLTFADLVEASTQVTYFQGKGSLSFKV